MEGAFLFCSFWPVSLPPSFMHAAKGSELHTRSARMQSITTTGKSITLLSSLMKADTILAFLSYLNALAKRHVTLCISAFPLSSFLSLLMLRDCQKKIITPTRTRTHIHFLSHALFVVRALSLTHTLAHTYTGDGTISEESLELDVFWCRDGQVFVLIRGRGNLRSRGAEERISFSFTKELSILSNIRLREKRKRSDFCTFSCNTFCKLLQEKRK